jgi:Mlc titration factor MtfA (ptsG expression regulator)
MLLIIIGILIIWGIWFAKPKIKNNTTPAGEDVLVNDIILSNNIAFFRALNKKEREQFKAEVVEFLASVKITGVNTNVANLDRILVAASAVIPVFAFPEWKYQQLKEVLLYADTFNSSFQTEGSNRNIMGMVGSGAMEGKMLLSKYALQQGFKNDSDKNNTAIHEFVHLVDKADGDTDGIPQQLLAKPYIIPWLDMTYRQMQEILKGKSDINPYGSANKAEFFAVVSEYFFERPDLLQAKHPDLYVLLHEIYKQDPEVQLQKLKAKIGRNDTCYCGSGLKYKDCHLQKDVELSIVKGES